MNRPDNPAVLILPPLLVIGTVALGFGLRWLVPWELPLDDRLRVGATGALLAIGIALGIAGERAMHRAGTNVHPRLPSTAVVTTGPFRFSRNPLYLFLICAYLTVPFGFRSAWHLLLVVPMLLILHFGVVLREERYLEAKFGDEYLSYRARVRRWL